MKLEGDCTMDKGVFLNRLIHSIKAINAKRYFSTERGYQGQLLIELNGRLKIEQIFHSEAIVEQEYQKTLKNHGISKRPDIIIHIPYEEEKYKSRHAGNFVVIQLKRKASEHTAREDFDKLDLMFEKLDYPLGIFLNVDSNETFFDSYPGNYKDRLHCFAVQLSNNEVVLYESP